MRLKACIRWTKMIIIGLTICLIGSFYLKCGYLIALSVIALLLSGFVLNYLYDTKNSQNHKVFKVLSRIQYVELDKQTTRENLFRSYTGGELR